MQQKNYSVDYHCSLAIYFRSDSQPTATSTSLVWNAFSAFGEKSAKGMYELRGAKQFKEKKLRIGSSANIPDRERDQVDISLSYIRKDAADAWLDADFLFTVHDSVSYNGGSFPPHFLVSISRAWAEELDPSVFMELLQKPFRYLDEFEPFYGLLDFSSTLETFGGTVFGSIPVHSFPVRQRSELIRWVHVAAKLGRKARGLYWGNYFGPDLLSQLGGRTVFLERFRHYLDHTNQVAADLLWEFDNGVAVLVCPYFLTMVSSPEAAGYGKPMLQDKMVRTTTWLLAEMARCGVLETWEPALCDQIQRSCYYVH